MSRLLSPDDAVKGVTIAGGPRYGGTVVDVTNPRHARMLKEAGYVQGAISGAPIRGGWRCTDCDFGSFFKVCGRCGGECERPDLVA
jgi:hypothetical protein